VARAKWRVTGRSVSRRRPRAYASCPGRPARCRGAAADHRAVAPQPRLIAGSGPVVNSAWFSGRGRSQAGIQVRSGCRPGWATPRRSKPTMSNRSVSVGSPRRTPERQVDRRVRGPPGRRVDHNGRSGRAASSSGPAASRRFPRCPDRRSRHRPRPPVRVAIFAHSYACQCSPGFTVSGLRAGRQSAVVPAGAATGRLGIGPWRERRQCAASGGGAARRPAGQPGRRKRCGSEKRVELPSVNMGDGRHAGGGGGPGRRRVAATWS
jgi:hypothetical protein